MTTYSDDSDYTDYTDYSSTTDFTDSSADLDPGGSDGYCCCGPADSGVDYSAPVSSGYDDTPVYDDPTGWDDPQPAGLTAPPAAPALGPDSSAVIPAGQPGGPELVSVATAPSASPTVATIGGTPEWQMSAPVADLYPSVATIGGHDPYGAITIVPADGATATSLPYGPDFVTIGPSAPDSMASSLASAYGIAAANGDILDQLLLTKTIATMQATVII